MYQDKLVAMCTKVLSNKYIYMRLDCSKFRLNKFDNIGMHSMQKWMTYIYGLA